MWWNKAYSGVRTQVINSPRSPLLIVFEVKILRSLKNSTLIFAVSPFSRIVSSCFCSCLSLSSDQLTPVSSHAQLFSLDRLSFFLTRQVRCTPGAFERARLGSQFFLTTKKSQLMNVLWKVKTFKSEKLLKILKKQIKTVTIDLIKFFCVKS